MSCWTIALSVFNYFLDYRERLLYKLPSAHPQAICTRMLGFNRNRTLGLKL
jgi:hypothetical protein